jgi:flagellar hook capping protein FlgD
VGWPVAGLEISPTLSDQRDPVGVIDTEGGAIVTWADDRNGDFDVYAQRVTATGAIASGWPANGIAVCSIPGAQQHPVAVPDGAGGAYVFWEDGRNGTDFDLYAQRVTASATIAAGWPANGLALCTASGDQLNPAAVANESGGAIVTWADHRSGAYDVYAIRVAPAGAVEAGWPAGGLLVCGASGDQVDPKPASDLASGAIIAWGDARSDSSDAYAQHVLASGAVDATWTASGVALSSASGRQMRPAIANDGAGGAIVAWADGRPNGAKGYDVYAARVTAAGAIAAGWTADGVALCTATGDQLDVTLVADASGGAIASWQDGRNGNQDIYAIAVTADGAIGPGWIPDGHPLCDVSGTQESPAIITDDAGGAIVAWADGRAADTDIYALRIGGDSAPAPILAVPGSSPARAWMLPPRPNPTRGAAEFALDLPAGARVRIEIHDLAGRRVRTLGADGASAPGPTFVRWDGRDESGRRVSAGVYLVRAVWSGGEAAGRVVVVE